MQVTSILSLVSTVAGTVADTVAGTVAGTVATGKNTLKRLEIVPNGYIGF